MDEKGVILPMVKTKTDTNGQGVVELENYYFVNTIVIITLVNA